MTIREKLEKGKFIDCLPLLGPQKKAAEDLPPVFADLVLFDWSMFERRMASKEQPSKPCVALIESFQRAAVQAPVGCVKYTFRHEDWICVASVAEDFDEKTKLNILIFSEQ